MMDNNILTKIVWMNLHILIRVQIQFRSRKERKRGMTNKLLTIKINNRITIRKINKKSKLISINKTNFSQLNKIKDLSQVPRLICKKIYVSFFWLAIAIGDQIAIFLIILKNSHASTYMEQVIVKRVEIVDSHTIS